MKSFAFLGLVTCALLVGCAPSEVAMDGSESGSNERDSRFLVEIEPANALPVGAARQHVKDAQQVSVLGVIGGSSQPFVDGLAAFTLVDPAVPYCAPEEGCPTPWDYCCTQDQVKDNIATVKIVDAAGKPVAASAKDLLGVAELATVVVSGKAHVDEQGNLSIAANAVFVRSNP